MVQIVIRATTVGCNVIFFRYNYMGSSCLLETVSNVKVSSVAKSKNDTWLLVYCLLLVPVQ